MSQGQKDPNIAHSPGTLKAEQPHPSTVSFEDFNWKSKPSFGRSSTFGTGYLYMAISVTGIDQPWVFRVSSVPVPSGTHGHGTYLHVLVCVSVCVCVCACCGWVVVYGQRSHSNFPSQHFIMSPSGSTYEFHEDWCLNDFIKIFCDNKLNIFRSHLNVHRSRVYLGICIFKISSGDTNASFGKH